MFREKHGSNAWRFRVWGLGLDPVAAPPETSICSTCWFNRTCVGFRVSGSVFLASGFGSRVFGCGFRISGFGLRVTGFRISGMGLRVGQCWHSSVYFWHGLNLFATTRKPRSISACHRRTMAWKFWVLMPNRQHLTWMLLTTESSSLGQGDF